MEAGHLLDAGAARGAEDEDRLLQRVVEDQSHEVFRGNRQLFLDQDCVDDIVSDLHPQQAARFRLGLVGSVRELDAAQPGPAGHPDLDLKDDGPGQPLGDPAGVFGRRRNGALGDGDPTVFEEGFALVFVESGHSPNLWSDYYLA